MRPLFLPIALLAAGWSSLALAQQPRPPGRPTAEFAEPFSRISGLRELADGRVIVTDSRENTVQLLDLRSGSAQRLSREGRGPGEYLSPGTLLAQPNDVTLLVDHGNRRFLRIGPDGVVVETVKLPSVPIARSARGRQIPPAMAAISLLPPRGVDRWGRLYFQPLDLGSASELVLDSTAILRWTIGREGIDTVGWVPSVTSGIIWASAETWQATPEGGIIRVSPDPYRITLIDSSGTVSTGATVAYTPIRVSEADRQERRDQQQAQIKQVVQADGSVLNGPPRFPELRFAATKPPFYGNESALVTPDGQIWIQRTRASGDPVSVYDIFDARGGFMQQISFGARSRLVGFGLGTMYVARSDDDDLEYLQRFDRPGARR